MVLIELVLFSSKWEEINKQAVLKPWQTKHGVYLAQSEESHGCMEDWFLNARTTHDVMHHHNQQKLLSPNARHNTLTFFSAGWMSFLSAQILKVLLNALIVMFYLNIKEKQCVSVLSFLFPSAWYGVRSLWCWHQLLLFVSLERGTSDLLGGLESGASRALFHPEIASESNFDLESHFGLFLQHSLSWTLITSLTWCSTQLQQRALLTRFSLVLAQSPDSWNLLPDLYLTFLTITIQYFLPSRL